MNAHNSSKNKTEKTYSLDTHFFPPKTITLGDIQITTSAFSQQNLPQGNTPFHSCIKNAKSINDIHHFIKITDRDTLTNMLSITNNEGQLPIHCLQRTTFSTDEKKPLLEKIGTLMLEKKTKPLNKPINFEQVVSRYHAKPNTVLYKNLQIACAISNIAREEIKYSCTHPYFNTLKDSTWHSLKETLEEFRARKVNRYTSDENLFKQILEPHLQTHLGNCNEFTIFGWFLCKLYDPSMTANIYTIINGDHTFLCIGNKQDAVICDAWTGQVYPASAMPAKLKVLYKLPATTRPFYIACPINLMHHKIIEHESMSTYQRLFKDKKLPNSFLPYQEKIINEVKKLDRQFDEVNRQRLS